MERVEELPGLRENGAKDAMNEKITELETRREMRDVVVPVNDNEVRGLLRQVGEPVTLFGEREMDRRERLRKLLTVISPQRVIGEEALSAPSVGRPKELFFTEGCPELKEARLKIARSSLSRANSRITQEKNSITTKDAEAEESLQSELLQVQNVVSEVADDRPVVSCQFSANGESLATASWSGNVKIWDIPSLTMQKSFHAHDERITGVAWRPILNSRAIIATGSVDTSAKLWDVEKGLLRTFQGHGARLARIGFHPMGEHLGTASFDQTWRLWDIESGNCLLEQEGHSKAVYAIAFQNDGALAASGGLDAYCRVWDLRTGRCILLLEGHVKGILSADFSPNGYLLATGSEDHTSRVYDLRKKGTLSILPGHNSLVSQVRFEPLSGKYLLSAGYDNVGKIWYGTNFKLIKTLAGHDAKVMGGDIRPSPEPLIATVGYDRTVKLWESKGM